MKRTSALLCLTLIPITADCCVTCNRQIQEAIFNSTFYPNLAVMLAAFFVIAIIVIVFTRLATKRYQARQANNPESKELAAVPLTAAGTVLGIGAGGFIDGIVLHQILQWHQMLTNKIGSDTVIAKSVNMFWDGIFHAYVLLATILGIYLLWKQLQRKDINRSGYLLAGGMMLGWGLFNIVEGIIDHHLLRLHNVRELSASPDAWNYGFLAFSVMLLLIGWMLVRRGERNTVQPGH